MAAAEDAAPADLPAVEDERPAEEERSVWKLNTDDKRLLLITFVGGLAANVGVVFIVGLGLALARANGRHPYVFGHAAAYIFFGILAFGLLAIWPIRHGSRRIRRRLLRIFIVIGIVSAAELLLALVGYAAGIT